MIKVSMSTFSSLLIFLTLLLSPQCITANNNFSIGGSTILTTENKNAQGGTGFNIYVEYQKFHLVSFRTSVGRYTANTKGIKTINKLPSGNYLVWFIEESIVYKFCEIAALQPYMGLGLGYYIIDREMYSYPDGSWRKRTNISKENINNVFSPHLRVGINILDKKVAANVDIKFALINSIQKEQPDLKTLFISLGLTTNF